MTTATKTITPSIDISTFYTKVAHFFGQVKDKIQNAFAPTPEQVEAAFQRQAIRHEQAARIAQHQANRAMMRSQVHMKQI